MGLLIRYGKEILKTDCQHTARTLLSVGLTYTFKNKEKPQK